MHAPKAMRSGLEAGLWTVLTRSGVGGFLKNCVMLTPRGFLQLVKVTDRSQIASLELLATLAAVLVFGVPVNMRSKMHCSAGTDNKGNSHVVARLLTTKFPLAAFLMELAMQLQCVGADLELYWLPRLQNQEADALTNDDLTRFDERLRMRFDLSTFKGLILSDMLACGTELHEEIRSAQRRETERHGQRGRKSDALRVAQPWGWKKKEGTGEGVQDWSHVAWFSTWEF